VPDHVRAALGEAPDIAAVYGSYDDAPPEPGWASLYMNLRHHFVHQRSAPFSETFWAGLGAVRRDAFRQAGGFDPARYPHPSIEDIELGGRLRAQGLRIRTRPAMQGTHLKRWTLGSVWFTDIFRRAIPWARLLLRRKTRTDELNVSRVERLKAVLAGLFFLAELGMLWPRTWPLLLAVSVLAWLANWRLFALLFRRGGPGAAVAGFLLHQCYYLYSSAVFLGCALEHRLRRK
jgi:GT2 family glycosyltransferase